MSLTKMCKTLLLFSGIFFFSQCQQDKPAMIEVNTGDHIIMVGGNLCSRMINFGHFETALYLRYPEHDLYIRNMCDGGDTPGFRPRSGRKEPWAFDGAEAFQDEYAQESYNEGSLRSIDEWIAAHEADVILGFFGFSESFAGSEGIENYKNELTAFIKHTLATTYNGQGPPKLALISPTAIEDLSKTMDLPNGKEVNDQLEQYTNAMSEVANEYNIPFIDLFGYSQKLFKQSSVLTIDGLQLNDKGYELISEYIVTQLSGMRTGKAQSKRDAIMAAVKEKNWYWHNDFKIPNGVHVFGRRYDPFGPANYPYELEKLRQMTAVRDSAIWAASQGETYDLAAADAQTRELPLVESNYQPSAYGRGQEEYYYGDEALNSIKVPEGYKIELFASEREFKDLANPVQLSFDNKGRLWVATMPTYPHWKPGDPRPNDKLLILEDTKGDGKADRQTIFAEGLHIPVGFEFAPEGVYVSQGTNLILLKDTDGDDHADEQEIIYSGFDDHDTHHVISAFCADPSGAIYMGEGVFLHTNVETPYGTVRATNGGFYRFSPQRRHLERTAQLSIPNPWGIAFDDWGQPIFAETSGPDVLWMLPGTVKSRYGEANHKSYNLIEEAHKVRPTSGLEFVSSRHFPDDVQGDMIINNSIGFLGTKQHRFFEEGTGYGTRHRLDLVTSDDKNFRPVDMEFAPDGSLYLVDWHNILVGHMQHNARDPYRDHVHGRIYRITYPSRPLVQPAKIVDASLATLLNNLKLPEYRTRYRTRRELRARDTDKVLAELKTWVAALDQKHDDYAHHLVEGLWVSWGMNQIDTSLLSLVLRSDDHRARAAGVRVVRYMGHQLADPLSQLKAAAADSHGRVRLEAIVAASWLPEVEGIQVLNIAEQHPLDKWMYPVFETAKAHMMGHNVPSKETDLVSNHLEGPAFQLFKTGKEIYERDGYCGTCHQYNGKGLSASGFPPLAESDWVTGSDERLIKLTLKGLIGPIIVNGKEYPGQVPMTPYEGLLKDDEVAAVLTYIRNDFGNKASIITPQQVAKVRAAVKNKKGFYQPQELLSIHPM